MVSELVHKIKQFVIDEDGVWMLILKAKVEWKFYSYRRRGRPLRYYYNENKLGKIVDYKCLNAG